MYNDGYQVWSLIKNKNDRGNIFIIYNEYIYNKYKNIHYILKKRNEIIVKKNCILGSFISKE